MQAMIIVNYSIQGCNIFLRDGITECSQVGIVTFESSATTTLQLTDVTEDNRDVLTDALPKRATGGTNIGAGIKLNVLKNL